MSGIRNINKVLNNHKKSFGNKFEVYFHQDLDGVTSALAIIKYLKSYGMILIDAHIIQYGSLEYAVPKLRQGSLGVLVDFANFKTMFSIATDHHDKQRGDVAGTSHTKPARCNTETISGEISNLIFTSTDMSMIQCVDSADFLKYNLNTLDIQNTLFKLNRKSTSEENRFNLGLVCNKLLLSYKSKRISFGQYHNKYLLECLVMDSESSIYSIYNNIQNYIKNATSLEWNMSYRSHNVPVPMLTQKEIFQNINTYKSSRIDTHEMVYDEKVGLIKQRGIGNVFKTGSYDRYVPFEIYPNSNFLATMLPFGFIQVSCNPFKPKANENINLADITKELLHIHSDKLKNINISISDIKKSSEDEIKKMKDRFGVEYDAIGFTFEDLKNIYPNSIISLPFRSQNDFKTRQILDLNIDTTLMDVMNKPYSAWSNYEIEEMTWYRIPLLDIVVQNSGGHKSITNIQGLSFLSTRKDLLKYYYKTENYMDVMELLFTDFIQILHSKYNGVQTNHDNNIKLGGIELMD